MHLYFFRFVNVIAFVRAHTECSTFLFIHLLFFRTLANSRLHLSYYYYSVCAAKAKSQTRPRLSKVNVENRIVLACLCARQQFFSVCGECCRRSVLSNKMVRWIDALAFGLNVKQVVTSCTRRNFVSLRFAALAAIRILLVLFDDSWSRWICIFVGTSMAFWHQRVHSMNFWFK